jgi:hypothetical protein
MSDLTVRLRAVISDFVSPMRTAAAEVKSFGAQVESTFTEIEQRGEHMSSLFRSVFEAFIGVELINGLKNIADAANQASDALEIAASNTKALGGSGGEKYVSDMDGWLRKLASSAQGGGYSLNEMRSSVQQFSTVTGKEAQQQRLLVDSLGLAAAKHIDLSEATHLNIMAATGHVEILSRYGIVTKDAAGQTLSFAQVMANEEALGFDAVRERAEGLEGAFGRVKNAMDRLVNSAFGQTLVKSFTAGANAVAHFLDALAGLPSWVQTGAAAIILVTASLASLGLMLPAIAKAFIIFRDGMQLAWALLGIGPQLVGFMVNGFRDLVTWLGLGRDAFATFTLAEWLAEAPVLAIVAAIAAIIAVVYELITHLNELGTAFENVTQYGQKAWKAFADSFADNAKSIGYGIMALAEASEDPGQAAIDLKKGQALSRDIAPEFFKPFKAGADGVVSAVKRAVDAIKKFFSSDLGNLKLPKIDWSGLGGPQKVKAGDLAALFAPIDAMLEEAKHKVEQAQNALEETTSKLSALRDSRDPNAALTVNGPTGVAAEQTLEREELQRTLVLRQAILEQRNAELRAAQLEQELQSRVTGTAQEQSKAHAEITKRMNEHVSAASKLNSEFLKMAGTIAKLGRDIEHAFDAMTLQQLSLDKTKRTETVDQQSFVIRQSQQAESGAFTANTKKATASPEYQAQHDIAQSQFDEQLAKLAMHLAEVNLAAAKVQAEFEKPETAAQTLATAMKALNDATLAHEKTLIALTAAHKELKDTVDQTKFSFSTFADGILKKLGIPGLSTSKQANADGTTSTVMAFDPTTFLLAAFENTKSFADIMNIVNQLMKVFSEILDALKPVIDALLQVIGFVANIFIDLYDSIAEVLRLFGIHIQLLDRINTKFQQNLIPFISIIHDIPTLNQLATGNIGPLSNQPTTYSDWSQVQQPTINAIGAPNLGGGLLGVLGNILEAILALKIAMAASAALGGSGGILGSIINFGKSIFGGGIPTFDGGTIDVGGSDAVGQWANSPNLTSSVLDATGNAPQVQILDSNGQLIGDSNPLSVTTPDATTTIGGVSSQGITTAAGLGTVVSTALAAAGLGGLGAALTGGNKTNGMIGGVVGAAAMTGVIAASLGTSMGTALTAALASGPLGIALLGGAALLGGVVGGLFGPHLNAQNNPDILNTQNYGQAMANLGGNGGADWSQPYMANGSAFTEDPNLASQLGGHGEVTAIADYIKESGGAGLDQNLKQLFSGATGVQYLKNGMVALGNGMQEYWSNLSTDAQTALTEMGSALTALGNTATNIVQGVSNAGNQLAGSTAAGSASRSGGDTRGTGGASVLVSITNQHFGDVVGVDDAAALTQAQTNGALRAAQARSYALSRSAVPT